MREEEAGEGGKEKEGGQERNQVDGGGWVTEVKLCGSGF